MLNKRGDFVGKSWLWLLFALMFLYLGLMPFGFLPLSFVMSDSLLRILIAVVGALIFIESFNYESNQKFLGIIIGLIFLVVGIYIYFMSLETSPISLPFVFEINNVFLQVILVIYAFYLAFAAFKQE